MVMVILWCCLLAFATSKELIMIQETFRHGARQPLFPEESRRLGYPIPSEQLGELTKQGKHMHYELGKIIYENYWKLLFKNATEYNVIDLYAKSTNVNRTL
jgi:hypothetical protein